LSAVPFSREVRFFCWSLLYRCVHCPVHETSLLLCFGSVYPTPQLWRFLAVDAYCVNDVIEPGRPPKASFVRCLGGYFSGTTGRIPTISQGRGKECSRLLENQTSRSLVGAIGACRRIGQTTALQPERRLSGESGLSSSQDVVAISAEV
jgi:hypothetical protein